MGRNPSPHALHPGAIQGKEGIKFRSVAERSHNPEARRAKHIRSKNLAIAIWQPCQRGQMAIAKFLDCMIVLPFGHKGMWLRYTILKNMIPPFPCIAPGWRGDPIMLCVDIWPPCSGPARGNRKEEARDSLNDELRDAEPEIMRTLGK